MADLEPILQNIYLKLEASLKGQDQLLAVLDRISVSTDKTQQALSGYKKAANVASKSVIGLSNSLTEYGRATTTATKTSEQFFNSLRRVGQLTRSVFSGTMAVAATATGTLVVALKQTGQSLLNFQIASRNASTAVTTLTKAYRGLGNSAKLSFVSLQQLADVMTKFQVRGFAERLTGASQEFVSGVEGIVGALTRVVGREKASEMFSGFIDVMENQFTTMRRTVEQQIAPLTQLMEKGLSDFERGGTLELQIAGKENYIRSVQEVINILSELALRSKEPGQVYDVINTLKSGMEIVKKTAPGSVAAVVSFNDAYSRLQAIIDDVQAQISKEFGPVIAEAIQDLNKWVSANLIDRLKQLYAWFGKISRWFTENKSDIAAVFGYMIDAIKLAAKAVVSLVKGFQELSTTTKYLLGAVVGLGAAWKFVPGVASTMKLLGRLALYFGINLVQATSKSQFLIQSLQTVGITGAKAFGVLGLGVAGAITGLKLAEKVATAFGFKVDGTVSSLSRIVGAAGGAAGAVALIAPPLAPIAGLVAAITTAATELYEQWSNTRAEIEKSRQAVVNSQRDTAKLKSLAQESKQKAILPIDKLRAEQKELEAILADLDDKKAKLEQEGVWLGFHIYTPETDEIDQQIAEVRDKIHDKITEIVKFDTQTIVPNFQLPDNTMQELTALDNRAQEIQNELSNVSAGSIQLDTSDVVKLVDELDRIKQRKQQIQQLGPMMQDLQKTRKEIQDLTNALDTPDVSKLKEIRDRLRELEQQKSIKEQEISVVITGIDRKGIERELKAIEQQFSQFQKQHEQMQVGLDVDEEGLGKSVEQAKQQFADLKEHIKQVDQSGQFDQTIHNIEQLEKSLLSGSRAAEEISETFEKFHLSLKNISDERLPRLDAFTSTVDTLAGALKTLGPNAEVAGRKLYDSINTITHEGFEESSETIHDLQQSLAEAFRLIDTDPKNIIGVVKAFENMKQIMGQLETFAKGLIAADEARLELVTLERQVREADLQIAQNLYGTPGLAVQTQLEVVKAMQAQKEIMESQLAITQQAIVEGQSRGDDVNYLVKQELELRSKIRNVTAEQLAQVKQLRDGYLDAVQAQAFAGGAFEKIIITREKNTMRGLQKNLVKYNYLLGQYGEATERAKAMPYRFSDQGMGMLEDLTGKPLSKEEIEQQNLLRIENINDPTAKSAALQAQRIVMGAQNNAEFIANTISESSGRTVDAINRLAENRIFASGGLLAVQSSPAGETAQGALVSRELNTQMQSMGRHNQESEQRMNQIAQHVDRARQADKNTRDSAAPANAVAPANLVPDIAETNENENLTDDVLFRKFLKQSLIYYKRSIFVLKKIAHITDTSDDAIQNLAIAPGQSAIETTRAAEKDTGYYHNVTTTVSNVTTTTSTTNITNQDRVTPPPKIDNYVSLPETPGLPDNYIEIPKIEVPATNVTLPEIKLPDNNIAINDLPDLPELPDNNIEINNNLTKKDPIKEPKVISVKTQDRHPEVAVPLNPPNNAGGVPPIVQVTTPPPVAVPQMTETTEKESAAQKYQAVKNEQTAQDQTVTNVINATSDAFVRPNMLNWPDLTRQLQAFAETKIELDNVAKTLETTNQPYGPQNDLEPLADAMSALQHTLKTDYGRQKSLIHAAILRQEAVADRGLAPRVDFSQIPADIFTADQTTTTDDAARLLKVQTARDQFEQNKKFAQTMQRQFAAIKTYIGTQISNVTALIPTSDNTPLNIELDRPAVPQETTGPTSKFEPSDLLKPLKLVQSTLGYFIGKVQQGAAQFNKLSRPDMNTAELEAIGHHSNILLDQNNQSQQELQKSADKTQHQANLLFNHLLTLSRQNTADQQALQSSPVGLDADVLLEAIDYRPLMRSMKSDNDELQKVLRNVYREKYADKIVTELNKLNDINNRLLLVQQSIAEDAGYANLRRQGDTTDALGFAEITPESKRASQEFRNNRAKLAKEEERLIRQQQQQAEKMRKLLAAGEKNKKQHPSKVADETSNVTGDETTKIIEQSDKQKEAQIKMGLRYNEEEDDPAATSSPAATSPVVPATLMASLNKLSQLAVSEPEPQPITITPGITTDADQQATRTVKNPSSPISVSVESATPKPPEISVESATPNLQPLLGQFNTPNAITVAAPVNQLELPDSDRATESLFPRRLVDELFSEPSVEIARLNIPPMIATDLQQSTESAVAKPFNPRSQIPITQGDMRLNMPKQFVDQLSQRTEPKSTDRLTSPLMQNEWTPRITPIIPEQSAQIINLSDIDSPSSPAMNMGSPIIDAQNITALAKPLQFDNVDARMDQIGTSLQVPDIHEWKPLQNYEIVSRSDRNVPDVYEGEQGVFAPNMVRRLSAGSRTVGNFSSQMQVVVRVLMEMAAEVDRQAERANNPIRYRRPGRYQNNIPG